MRKVIGLMKVKPAIELAEDILVDSGKVVLFAIHKDVVAQLEQGLKKYNVVKIVGDTPQKDRNDIVNRFQSEPEVRVAIISEAGGEGINLFAASNLIFVEREWNPGKETQIMGRVHRIGQTNPVSIYYIIAKNTIDERLHRLIEKKAEVLGQVISFESIPINDLFDIGEIR
jgi:SNF2 family DNA or RNA helicase